VLRSAVRVPAEIASLLDSLVHSPDAVFATDRQERIIFWNVQAEHLLGYQAEEVVGKLCSSALSGCDVFGNRYCTEACPVTRIATRGESVKQFGLELKARDGHFVSADVSILHLAVRPPDHFVLLHTLTPRGRGTSLPEAEARETPPRPILVAVRESQDVRAHKLTPREVEILGMLAAGHPTPEIAERLHISVLTARNHIQNVLEKLEVHSKAEAVAFAFQQHIL
jgi:DNA-binding CsgD family transcriptional regulator/PAS domain-containing protein